jgi:hypothetical protein
MTFDELISETDKQLAIVKNWKWDNIFEGVHTSEFPVEERLWLLAKKLKSLGEFIDINATRLYKKN